MAQTMTMQSLYEACEPFRLALQSQLHFQDRSVFPVPSGLTKSQQETLLHFQKHRSILAPVPSGVTKSQQETLQPTRDSHEDFAKLAAMLEETLTELEMVKDQSRELVSKNKKLARENMMAHMEVEVERGTSASLHRELEYGVTIHKEMLRRMQEQEESNEDLRAKLSAEKALGGQLERMLELQKLEIVKLECKLSKEEAKNKKDKEAREKLDAIKKVLGAGDSNNDNDSDSDSDQE